MKPTEFEDLIALVALYRPGPMQYIPSYAARKNGREAVRLHRPAAEADHRRLRTAISIYQEQSMEIAKQIAGFTGAEAETLRRAIGKKIHELMASLKGKFLDGCAANGVTPAVADQLWKDMEESQDYSFNKAHAACYALIAYRTAWLKANHPCEYMAALISSVMNTKDRVPFYVNACDEMGIEVLPPDVNSSTVDFAVVEGKIRFGLNAVKNVGETAAQRDRAAREDGGPFASIWDFTERVDPQVVNKRSLESLFKCGALDSTGPSRMGMLAVLEQALGYGQKLAQDRLMGQSLALRRRLRGGRHALARHHPPIPTGEFEKQELLRLEKETLGLYVSEHPLSGVRDQLRRKTDATLAELERRRDGEVVTVGGIVSDVKHLTTKRGEPMVFLTLDDPTGSAEVVVFNSTYAAARELCVTDRILVVKGRVDHKQQGETKLIALEVTAFEAVPERREVRFSLDAREAPAGVIRELARLVARVPRRVARLPLARDLRGPEDATPSAPSTVSAPTRTSSPRHGPARRVCPVVVEAPRCRARSLRRGASRERRLQEDLEREIHAAAALEERDGEVEVDLGRGGEDGGGLGVVAGALERVEAPELDALDLEVDLGGVDDRHRRLSSPNVLPRLRIRVNAVSGCPVVRAGDAGIGVPR